MKQCRWLLTLALLLTSATAFAVPRGQKWEQTITTDRKWDWTTAKLCVQYTAPSLKVYTGTGFWNNRGASTDTFKIRAAFNELGDWNWTLLNDAGCLNTATVTSAKSGVVNVTADTTGNPMYALTPVRVNVGGRHLQFSGNAARFHWIGDTSWGGPHRAPIGTWQTYTTNRRNRGYSVIQVAAPTATGAIVHADVADATPFLDPAGGAACSTGPLPRAACLPNPQFWTAWDAHIDDINAQHMYAAIIGLFKRTDESAAWPLIADSKGYARFIAARVAGNHTALAPGFDEIPRYAVGNFTGCELTAPGTENQACRAREVGRAIKEAILLQTTINASPRSGTPLTALVTHHMGGGCRGGFDGETACAADAWMSTFHVEDWLDFSLIQSGQGANCDGDPRDCIAIRAAKRIRRLYYWDMQGKPPKPVINGEAVYDNAGIRACGATPDDIYIDRRSRQAAFNTLLSGGAGFTHGVGGTWDWGGSITCRSVSQGLSAASATQIGKLKAAFSTLPWQRLVPDCQLWGDACSDIKNSEQTTNPAWQYKRMYAADANGQFAVAYLPVGVTDASLKLSLDNLPGFTTAAGTTWRTDWYNPRSGCTCAASPILSGTTWNFTRPSNNVDWGLLIRNSSSIPTLGVNACTLAGECP